MRLYVILSVLSFVYVSVCTRANTCLLYPMCMSYVSLLHIFEFTCTVVIMVKVEIEMVINDLLLPSIPPIGAITAAIVG